ncbi:hypothetical protein C2U72_04735 [Prosthecomicrobium hirschii]|uniref:BatD family protein n=1 Tax=Prosthecodimorpha hirschii TaxID=665126 RepID=UPI00112D4A2B|nr:BatD family protein [Prosthecomicrobium hirschii]TPQ52115.1 hypothetical protein C2U72_04735 [Prosthecomicrobium hirschii]
MIPGRTSVLQACRLAVAAGLALVLVCAFATFPIRAETADFVGPDDARLTVTIDAAAPEPYAREMILVRIRGLYTVQMTLETLDQPDLTDFAWMQLGRDRWTSTTAEGRPARSFERVMALFPKRAGVLTVPSFRHHLTLLAPDGSRVPHDVVSAPIAVTVQVPPPGGWWLPARALQLTDRFDRDPTALPPGETARRTVTIDAEGISADQLPPIPSLRAPGVIAFPEPETRTTRLTREGPVATVVWHWTLRSMTGEPATVPEVAIRWFDTRTRKTEAAVIAAATVAAPGRFGAAVAGTGERLAAIRAVAVPGGLAAGLALGLGLLLAGRRLDAAGLRRALSRLTPDPDRRAMRRAVRAGDAAAFRAAALRWAGRNGCVEDDQVATALAGLGAAVFGRPGQAEAPGDLRRRLHAIDRLMVRRRRRM